MKKLLFIFVILFSVSFVFAQKQYKRTTTVDEQTAWLKTAAVCDIESLIGKCNPNDPAMPLLISLKNEKLKKNKIVYLQGNKKQKGEIIKTNDSTLALIVDLIKEVSDKVDGLDARIGSLEQALLSTNSKIEILAQNVAVIMSNATMLSENSSLEFLARGELVLFNADYLALTTNDETLNLFASKMNSILGIRLNPLDFKDYRKGTLPEDAQILVKRVIKTVGTIDADPAVVWEYLVDNGNENSAIIKARFAQF